MSENTFSVVDYVIFALLLFISASIGIFYGCFGKKQTSSKELLLGNRQMGVMDFLLMFPIFIDIS